MRKSVGIPMRRDFTLAWRLLALVALLGGQFGLTGFRGDALASDSADLTYFALGDSIASGHGLMDGPSPADPQNICRRSTASYPYRVVEHLAVGSFAVHFSPANHLACTGATVGRPPTNLSPNSIDPCRNQDPLRGVCRNRWLHDQVDQVLAALDQRRPDHKVLVSITIGSNDFYFSEPATLYQLLYTADSDTYRAAMDDAAQVVRTGLTTEVRRLLAQPNVIIVLTEPINPFNRTSVFFLGGSGRLCREIEGGGENHCYARVEYGLEQLKNAEQGVLQDIHQPGRLVMTHGLGAAFTTHAAPRPSCGSSPPDVAETWIQYRYDPASNSDPTTIPAWVGPLSDRGAPWRGDCFHPNAAGADAFAAAVVDAALPLLAGDT